MLSQGKGSTKRVDKEEKSKQEKKEAKAQKAREKAERARREKEEKVRQEKEASERIKAKKQDNKKRAQEDKQTSRKDSTVSESSSHHSPATPNPPTLLSTSYTYENTTLTHSTISPMNSSPTRVRVNCNTSALSVAQADTSFIDPLGATLPELPVRTKVTTKCVISVYTCKFIHAIFKMYIVVLFLVSSILLLIKNYLNSKCIMQELYV